MAMKKKAASKKKETSKKPAPKPAAKPAAAKPAKETKETKTDAPALPSAFQELSTAAGGVAPKKGEEAAAFYERLLDKLNDVSDEDFKKLSKPAQKWYNDAGEVVNDNSEEKDESKHKEIPELPGSPFAEADEEEEEQQEEEKADKKKPATKEKDKPAAKKEKKKKDEEDDDGERANNSMAQRVRIEVCKNINISDADLIKAVKAADFKGFNEDRAITVAKRTRAVLVVKAGVDSGKIK